MAACRGAHWSGSGLGSKLYGFQKNSSLDPLVAATGNGAARSGPGEQAVLDLDALGFCLILGEANPGHFGVGVGDA